MLEPFQCYSSNNIRQDKKKQFKYQDFSKYTKEYEKSGCCKTKENRKGYYNDVCRHVISVFFSRHFVNSKVLADIHFLIYFIAQKYFLLNQWA